MLPEAVEAAKLTLEVASRLAEAVKAERGPILAVQLDQGVNQLIGDLTPLLGVVEVIGDGVGDHVAVHLLHDVERRSNHSRVGADREYAGRTDLGWLQCLQKAGLAQHIVCAGRQRPAGRPSQTRLPWRGRR